VQADLLLFFSIEVLVFRLFSTDGPSLEIVNQAFLPAVLPTINLSVLAAKGGVCVGL